MPQFQNNHRESLLYGGQLKSRLEGHWRDISWGVSSFTCRSLSTSIDALENQSNVLWKLRYFVKGSSPASAGDVLTCGDCRLVALQQNHPHPRVIVVSSSNHHHISLISSSTSSCYHLCIPSHHHIIILSLSFYRVFFVTVAPPKISKYRKVNLG